MTLQDAYIAGYAAAREAAVAICQQHMTPMLARRLAEASQASDVRGGFLLAAEHLRDDINFMADPTSEDIAAAIRALKQPAQGGEG